jgi:hypothetical protein
MRVLVHDDFGVEGAVGEDIEVVGGAEKHRELSGAPVFTEARGGIKRVHDLSRSAEVGRTELHVSKHRITFHATSEEVVGLVIAGSLIEAELVKRIVAEVDPIEKVCGDGVAIGSQTGCIGAELQGKREVSVRGNRRDHIPIDARPKRIRSGPGVIPDGLDIFHPALR